MGSKAKSKARNKAKRTGVPNAATAATSAAAAAAAHVAKDIQADSNMGVPATAAADASAPHEQTPPAQDKQASDIQKEPPHPETDSLPAAAAEPHSPPAEGTPAAPPAEPSSLPAEPSDGSTHEKPADTTEVLDRALQDVAAKSNSDAAAAPAEAQQQGADVSEANQATTAKAKSGPDSPVADSLVTRQSGTPHADLADSQTHKDSESASPTATLPGADSAAISPKTVVPGSVRDPAESVNGASQPQMSKIDEAREPSAASLETSDRTLGAPTKPGPSEPFKRDDPRAGELKVDEQQNDVLKAIELETKIYDKSKAPEKDPPTSSAPAGPEPRQDIRGDKPSSESKKAPTTEKSAQPELKSAAGLELEAKSDGKNEATQQSKAGSDTETLHTSLEKVKAEPKSQTKSKPESSKSAARPKNSAPEYTTESQDEFYLSITAAVQEGKLSSQSLESARIKADENVDVIAQQAANDSVLNGIPGNLSQPSITTSVPKSKPADPIAVKDETVDSTEQPKAARQLSDLKSPAPKDSSQDTPSTTNQLQPHSNTKKDKAQDAALAVEVAEAMSDRPVSPMHTLTDESEKSGNASPKPDTHSDQRALSVTGERPEFSDSYAQRGNAEDSQDDELSNTGDNEAALEEDEFYRSISAAGREAQRSSGALRHEEEATDELELDAELERAQEQENAFDKFVSARREREAELREEGEALENYREAVAAGVADVEEEDLEAREAEAIARREAEAAAQLSEEVNKEGLNSREADTDAADESGDFYGALATSTNAALPDIIPSESVASNQSRTNSDVEPHQYPADSSAIDDSMSSTSVSKLSVEGDAFYRSLSSGGTPQSPLGRLQTEDFGEERVNSDFDGIIGKTEGMRGGSSSVISSPAPSDDFFASLQTEAQPALPSAALPSIGALNLELDDDFLDDEDEEERNEVTTVASSGQKDDADKQPGKPAMGLSFLESDDDLLPEDEDKGSEFVGQAPAIGGETDFANVVSDTAAISLTTSTASQTEPSAAPDVQQLRPRPSMTEFHTDKQGFDLPLEILPQPVKRHAPQRVASRAGTPQGSVTSPRAAPAARPPVARPPAPGVPRGTSNVPNSPPRSVPPPQPRAVPSRVPSRPQSSTAASKYKPMGSAGPDVAHPIQNPPGSQTPQHDLFMTQTAPPQQHSGWKPPAASHASPATAALGNRPVAPRPAANPDPYGFPGLAAPAVRRVTPRASNPGSRRASGAVASSASSAYTQGTAPAVVATPPPVTEPPRMSAPPVNRAPPPPHAVAPQHGAIPIDGTSPVPGSPHESISPRTVLRPPATGNAASHFGARQAGTLSAPNLPPTAVMPPLLDNSQSGKTLPQQYEQFGAPLRPPSVPQRTDSRSRYTPSPLNAPVASVGPPRGDHPEEELLKRQRALFVWGPRAWVQVVPENQFGTSGASVHTGEVKPLAMLSQAAMAKFPLPAVNTKGPVKTKRKELEKWLGSVVSADEPGLLYSILRQLLGSDEGRDARVREALRAHSKIGSQTSAHAPTSMASTTPVPEILSMLRDGNREGAMQAALDARSYAHALTIAHALGGDHWRTALNEFVAEEVRRQDPQLAFVYRALGASDAASGAAALGELKPRGQTELVDLAGIDTNLERWADAAAALYGGGAAAHAALTELGALLVDRGRIEEGHTCFVLVGIPPGSPKFGLPLVGNKGSPSFDSFVLAELYEFVLGKSLPSLLPAKIAFAGLLADCGYDVEAHRIAENASALAKAMKAPPKLLEEAARMMARCSSAASAQGTWLQRKLSRPNLEKTWVSSFNKFVSGGDDEESQVPRPQSAGMPAVPENIPQRQSYTPGPYPGRPESYYSTSAMENSPAAADFGATQTSSRPAPINEVNEEYAGSENALLLSRGSRPLTPQYAPQQYAPQQHAPQQYAPPQYAPQQYAPQQYAPQQYAPQQYASHQYPEQRASQHSVQQPVQQSVQQSVQQPSLSQQPSYTSPNGPGLAQQLQSQGLHASVEPAAAAADAYGQRLASHEGYGFQADEPVAADLSGYLPRPTSGSAPSGSAPNISYAPLAASQQVPQEMPQNAPQAYNAPPANPQGPYAPRAAPQGGPTAAYAGTQGGRYAPPEASLAQAPEMHPTGQEAAGQPQSSDPLSASETSADDPKVKPESEPKKAEEQPKKKGWLSWLKKEDPNAQKPYKVKLGTEAKLIYDKESKRWYKEGEPRPEPKKGPPPPPKATSHTPAQGSQAPGSAVPGPLAAGPPVPGHSAPGNAVPHGPVPPGPVAATGQPGPGPAAPGGVAQSSTATPTAASPAAAVPAPPAAAGIDGILAASASAAGRKKRPARSRYVNVTDSGLPEGMAQ